MRKKRTLVGLLLAISVSLGLAPTSQAKPKDPLHRWGVNGSPIGSGGNQDWTWPDPFRL